MSNANGAASYPEEGELPLSSFVPPEGVERYYQVTYRNAADFCTSATFNITNGIRAVWLP